MEIRIGPRMVGGENRPYTIADIASNHGGNVYVAMELVKEAADCGVDAVKFQHPLPHPLGLTRDDLDLLVRAARDVGVEFLCTALTPEGLKDILEAAPDLAACKVASIHFDSWLNLTRTDRPAILSTGHSSLWTIEENIKDRTDLVPIVLMHCVSLYPTPAHLTRVGRLRSLRRLFKDQVVYGYSDHCVESVVPAAVAVAMGAKVLECHFRGSCGATASPDHAASRDIDGLKAWLDAILIADRVRTDSGQHPAEAKYLRELLPREDLAV